MKCWLRDFRFSQRCC